jgi:hypothetical protein
MAQIAKEVAPHIRKHKNLRARIEALPELSIARENNDALLKQFGNDGDGQPLTEKLLGLWLGEFDLLVIDEAHKSRDDDSADEGKERVREAEKVLPRLLDHILIETPVAHRLCLTATPMELALEQWLGLLDRARSGLDRETGKSVIDAFQKATKAAADAPDEAHRLDALIKTAKSFEKALDKYVTRRRRSESEEIKTFRSKLVDENQKRRPHPHRNVKAVPISWAEAVRQNGRWLDVLFAAECMSQSALGLNRKVFEAAIQLSGRSSDEKKKRRLNHLIRGMYARLISGHLSADIFDADVRIVPPDGCDVVTRGKLQRTEYWRSRIQRVMKRGLHEDEHPRILAAVKEIEGWTLKCEKVLVFGVFLRPLRLLRDVLNARHALRAADAGRPIAHAVHTDAVLLGIALRQLDRLRVDGALSERLATGNGTEMCRALAESHKAYERLRDKVRRHAKKPVVAWCTDPSLLGGAPVDHRLERALEDHLVSFVLDDFLATTSDSDEVTDEHFDALTGEFVEERLRPLLGELGDEDVDEKQAVLRLKALHALLEDDDGRQSFHARLLQGATRWETRRYLQSAFNRPGASPSILIAQSQVGREGLNLHESCRVVVQFHAEWNPAVLEQQIGRVDRKGSHWSKLAQQWLDRGAQGDPPFIEVRQLIFDGTYDEYQWERVRSRLMAFDATLFGSLLPQEAWDRVPESSRERLSQAAPDFSPIKK